MAPPESILIFSIEIGPEIIGLINSLAEFVGPFGCNHPLIVAVTDRIQDPLVSCKAITVREIPIEAEGIIQKRGHSTEGIPEIELRCETLVIARLEITDGIGRMAGHRPVRIVHHSHREALVGDIAPDALLINGGEWILVTSAGEIDIITHFQPGEGLDIPLTTKVELVEIVGIVLEDTSLSIIPS